jgi:DNA-binding HxlR family transcriptional regulator
LARSVDVIGDWGSLMILRQAFGGTTRFDDFQQPGPSSGRTTFR